MDSDKAEFKTFNNRQGPPPVSDNDKGSPGMVGASSAAEIEHETDPSKPVDPLQKATKRDPVQIPPDIGGGD